MKKLGCAALFLAVIFGLAWGWDQLPVGTVATGIGAVRNTIQSAVQKGEKAVHQATQATPTPTPTPASTLRPPVLRPLSTPTPTPACIAGCQPEGNGPGRTPPPAPTLSTTWPAGEAWMANTLATAPLFQPYEARDPALMAAGSSGATTSLISPSFGYGPSEAARVTPSTLTPMGNLASQARGWTTSDCNYAMDFLSVDEQLDGAAAQSDSWYYQWAGDWTVALQVTKDYCFGVRERSVGTIEAIVGYLESAEQLHVAAYGGTADAWDREWGDGYLALVQLFWRLPVTS